MIEIPLQTIPNQTLSIRLDNQQYDIEIHTISNNIDPTNLIMAISITRDNVLIVDSFRAVSGYPILPYEYLENGNFAFITDSDDYPDYTRFGIDQSLIFASESELEALRVTT